MSTPETLTRELAALDDALAGRPVDPDLADLAEFAALVRDERPSPDPAFASSLDERARAGFPRSAKRRMPAFSWPKITLPALGLAASVFLVVVIATSIPGGGDDVGDAGSSGGGGAVATTEEAPSSGSSGASGDESSGGGASARAQKQGAPSAAEDSAGSSTPSVIGPLPPEPPSPGNPSTDTRTRRYVQRSAQIVIATPPRNVDRAAAKIIKVADDLGGFVISSQVSSGSSGEFELRVPERRLQTALSRLSAVGKVRERTQAAQDITGAVASVADRLRDARTERRSLLRQLAKATTVNQTESIRRRLRIVSGEIAAAKRDLRNVKRRASYSTISVQLLADRNSSSASDDDDSSSWTPSDAWRDAGRILEVSAGVLMIAAALALPIGLVLLLIWLAMRQAAQRRRERALDAV
jgi:Domain of unknown function (DUF4349)